MSYTAQRLAREDIQNRLRVDIVPGALLELKMGVSASIDYRFYGLWSKALANVAETSGTEIADELAAALEKAEEATEAKQNFFSKMSHDIRTPLNVVLGMTQIARKYKNDDDKLKNALGNITTEGNYLLVLINSILDVNQLEHGAIELLNEPFSPPNCLYKSADILRPLAGKKEQELTVHCDRTDRVVLGDGGRLKQIIFNIISNAIKYTGEGGHIDVQLECLPGHRYRFSCRDNGIGMSEEFVQHICEDYARAENSRVSKVQGTGLGMSVVKGFTDRMGGTLHIESELGKGLCVLCRVPLPRCVR